MENNFIKLHQIDLMNRNKKSSHDDFLREGLTTDEKTTAHESIQICLIAEGNGTHRFFDQEIPCKAGDVYIIPPNVPHSFSADTCGLAIDWLSFAAKDWFEGEFAEAESPRFCYGIFRDQSMIAYAALNECMQKEVNSLLANIECELTEKRQEWQEAVRTYLIQFFITVGRYINCAIKNDTPVSSKDWSLVLSMMRMAKNFYADCNFTLETISNTLYVSRSHLSRRFKELTGQMFSEYLREIRIENACRLLRDTNMNVDEIVERCGMRDLPSFYHNFSVQLHTTPRQYRQMILKEKNNINTKTKGDKIMSILTDISENLQKGKAKIVKELVQQALDEGVKPEQILNEGLLYGMSIIGEKFKNNEVYVPEVLVAARAMNMGAQILKPVLAEAGVQATGKVCLGTVQGDLHDIGKNLVKMMMEGKGLEVIDLGTDVAPETFIKTAIEQDCKVICCSALLTTTMNVMEEVIKAAEAAGIRDKVKIMIGGAPVNQEFCDKIGADCYTFDAASAADAAVAFCKA